MLTDPSEANVALFDPLSMQLHYNNRLQDLLEQVMNNNATAAFYSKEEICNSNESMIVNEKETIDLSNFVAFRLNKFKIQSIDNEIENASCSNDDNINEDAIWNEMVDKILVIPHICSWEMSLKLASLSKTKNRRNELFDTLYALPSTVLQHVYDGLNELLDDSSPTCNSDNNSIIQQNCTCNEDMKLSLCIAVVDHPHFWTRVILYNDDISSTVRGAISAPPYYPQYWKKVANNVLLHDFTKAEIDGPFPFQFYTSTAAPAPASATTRKADPSPSNPKSIHVSLGYVLDRFEESQHLPTMDFVPSFQLRSNHFYSDSYHYNDNCYYKNFLTRAVRYVMLYFPSIDNLISSNVPFQKYVQVIEECYEEFLQEMYLVQQNKGAIERVTQRKHDNTLLSLTIQETSGGGTDINGAKEDKVSIYSIPVVRSGEGRKLCVYTDTHDPMGLYDPISGLESNSHYFTMVEDPKDADILFSFMSLFIPKTPLHKLIQERNHRLDLCKIDSFSRPLFINQFPYEEVLEQKDRLAQEILEQHGLPRPFWAIESYNLDAHLVPFVGATLAWKIHKETDGQGPFNTSKTNHCIESDPTTTNTFVCPKFCTRGKHAVWIIKPSKGTRSKGPIVTRSIPHALRIIDANGTHCVAQKYIENPVCFMGKKVDCRVIVLITNAQHHLMTKKPTIYMHRKVSFRIANKEHRIDTSYELFDHEIVSTCKPSDHISQPLPKFHETIRHLQATYSAFDWNNILLPKIQIMIRELWNGMTLAYPVMGQNIHSRAIYGVDVMFEIESDNTITPKLTEVTLCPTNNSVFHAHERDDDLYKSYNKEIFEALYLGIISTNITKLQ